MAGATKVDRTVYRAKLEEVVENDYVLSVGSSVGSYVDEEDTSEHLTLPEIRQRIAECVKRENELRTQLDAILKEVMDE